MADIGDVDDALNSDHDERKPSGLPKHLEQNRDSDRLDSGFGDDNSLSLSNEDRSCTGSDSMGSKSRDQVCDDGDGFATHRMAKLRLSDKSSKEESGHCEQQDSGIFSGTFSAGSSLETSKPSFMNSFAQSNDIRYLLAPFWLSIIAPNQDGDTSLHLAIIHCQVKVVDAIMDVIQKKEFLDLHNDLIQTPLHLAVITRQPRIVQKLIDRGASVDLTDRNGQTCLHLASQRGDIKLIKAIFNPRPDKPELKETLQEILEAKNFEGLTPLHIAVLNNNLDVVTELISLGADANEPDGKSGHTALHLAVEQNNLLIVSYLLFQGRANPDALSYSECSPLHLAAGLGLKMITATLIAAGANQSIVNSERDTPFEIASEDIQELDIFNDPFEPMEV